MWLTVIPKNQGRGACCFPYTKHSYFSRGLWGPMCCDPNGIRCCLATLVSAS
jgi:hypothetical protein